MGPLDLAAPRKGIDDLDLFFSSFFLTRPLLVCDYDGTLAPFRKERAEAVPEEKVRLLLLEILDEGGDIVVLSGRRAEEVAGLLRLPLEIWGSHGWERRTARGDVTAPPLSPENTGRLESLRRELADFPGDALEIKPVSLALHWRERPEVKKLYTMGSKLLEGAALERGFQILPFSGGIEFRLPLASKKTAMELILNARSSRDPVCYMGDDMTDEDAFEAVGGSGIGVLVAEKNRPSAATVWIRPCSVESFLGLWKDGLKRKRENRP